jgi:hypothetical protein
MTQWPYEVYKSKGGGIEKWTIFPSFSECSFYVII